MSTYHQVWIGGEYDLRRLASWPDIRRRYDDALAAGRTPVIVDGGANVGLSARYFHTLFPEARIVALEPEASNFEIARKNVEGLPKVDLMHAALWSERTELALRPSDLGHESGFQTVTGESGAMTPATSVDALMADLGPGHEPFLVKMDIEGAERQALYGAVDAQIAGAIFVIEPHDWLEGVSGSLDGIEALVTHWSFDFFTCGENVVFVPLRRKPAAEPATP